MKNLSEKNRKKGLVLLILCIILLLIYGGVRIYALFHSELDAKVQLKNGTWNIVVNGTDIAKGTDVTFAINNISTQENEHVKPGNLAPGLTGNFKISIDPQDTNVSVKYEISLDEGELTNNNITIKSITETQEGNQLVKVGDNTYAGIIPLEKLKMGDTNYDTQYFDQKLGIKIIIFDNNGNRLSLDSLFGVNFELDGKLYYPRVDGTTRINIAEKVTDVLARIKMNTKGNNTLATGDYKIEIESFGSPDGIYYGLTASDKIALDLRIINSAYGLKVTNMDPSKIVNKDTGMAENESNSVVTTVRYSSQLAAPNISVSLYRRDYSTEYSQDYVLVDLQEYVSDTLTLTAREKEYLMSTTPMPSTTNFYKMKENLITGTYKIVYKLYDGNTYVGEAFDYLVIK